MIWSAYIGLSLSLEGVGAVLGLGKQKLAKGKELIKNFRQPCAQQRPTVATPAICQKTLWTNGSPSNAITSVRLRCHSGKTRKLPGPEAVWEKYHLDQGINDRGVALDMELVRQAIAMDTCSRAELTTAIKN